MSKLAIITGASKGIGKACAIEFLAQDWQVINISRNPCQLAGVDNISVDFSQADALLQHAEALLAKTRQQQRISLIHNAALFHKDSIQDVSSDVMQTSMAVNVIAPLQLNQLLLKQMPSGSSIIYIGSTLSEKAVANTASYSIAKHAVVGMMRATCQDLAHSGIHTCCVCPGFTNTEMLRSHIQHDDQVLSTLAQRVGENRLIEPNEIANTVLFCANNSVINGSVIHAHLGQLEI